MGFFGQARGTALGFLRPRVITSVERVVAVVAPTDAYYVLTKANAALTNSKVHPNSGAPNYNVAHNVSDLIGDTDDLSEGGTNLYYTEVRVSANTDVTTNSAKVTESTTVTAPLALSTYDISIPKADTDTSGYLDTDDWDTFNGKSDLALGTTSTTAHRGDYGTTAYNHVSADGTSHTYIDQDLRIAASPTFAGVTTSDGNDISCGNKIDYDGTTKPKKTIVLTAAGGWPSTSSGCAANAKVEYGTNDQDIYHLDFDPDSDEYAQWTIVMPDAYDGGTITAVFVWAADSASTDDVVWGLQGIAYADSDPIDASWGSGVAVTDTNLAQNDVNISAATGAITLAGSPAGGQLVQFRVYRDADNVADDLAADARLIAVKIEYGVTSESD